MRLRIEAEGLAAELIRSSRKSCEIRVCHNGTVEIRGPHGFTPAAAAEALKQKRRWIEERLERLRARQAGEKVSDYRDGGHYLWNGEPLPLQVRIDPAATHRRAALREGLLVLELEASDEAVVKTMVEHWGRRQGAQLLPKRLTELALQVKVPIGKVSVRDQQKRWGSCSASGNISLSWRLMRMSPAVRDSVLLHELAHRVHLNHSDAFYRLLESWQPEYRNHHRWLKEHGRSLHA